MTLHRVVWIYVPTERELTPDVLPVNWQFSPHYLLCFTCRMCLAIAMGTVAVLHHHP